MFGHLPPTWTTARLRDICVDVQRVDPTSRGDGSFEYVDIASINNETKEIVGASEIRNARAPSRARQIIKNDDILISTVRPNLNAVALVPEQLDDAICSTGLCVLRPSPGLMMPEYLFAWARTSLFVALLTRSARGIGYPAVSDKDVLASQVPLPTLPEQQRIVEILKHADTVRRQRREVTTSIADLTNATFVELFHDYLNHDRATKLRPLKRYVKSTQYGTSENLNEEGDTAVLRMNNLTEDGWVDIGNLKYLPRGSVDLDNLGLAPGDLIFNRTNSRELVGKTAIWSGEIEYTSFASYLVRIRFKGCDQKEDDCVLPEYVWGLLNSPYGKSKLLNMAKQAVSMANINPTELGKMRIPIPPLELQARFRIVVHAIRGLRTSSMSSEPEFEALSQAAASDAFSGRLTESWREAHFGELEGWLIEHTEQLPKKIGRISVTEVAPPERASPRRPARRWLMDQLSAVQMKVYLSLQEWKGTLIPAEDLGRFLEVWPNEDLEDAHDQVLRALNQLEGLGLAARVSIPNQIGEYVSGYRILREDELSKHDDLERLGASS